ncbi:MAG TPA: hypothetical protein H9903_12695 [Candidatus Aquabacterium excrementipullorum]|nr:hypothetical protein [Candidatus Aquabacterium excrementipullorum]
MGVGTSAARMGWLLGAVASLTASPVAAQEASFTPFTLVEVTTDEVLERIGNDDAVVLTYERAVHSNFAQVGSSPSLYAKGRAGFGETGAYAIASGQRPNVGAYAETSWSDAFTILGGEGEGVLTVNVRVDGHFVGTGQPGGPGPNALYALFRSDSPVTVSGMLGYLDEGDAPPDGSSAVIGLHEAFSGTQVYTADIHFTYGKTFYLASYLGAEVLGDGVADFYGSAHFGATAPGGASIQGLSGTTY